MQESSELALNPREIVNLCVNTPRTCEYTNAKVEDEVYKNTFPKKLQGTHVRLP